MTTHYNIYALLCLLWLPSYDCNPVYALKPVRPKSEIRLTEREMQPLQGHIDIEKGTREDSIQMRRAADSIALAISQSPAEETMQGVEIEVDKKIVLPQSLGLAESNTLREILEFIPELLNRGGDDLLSNFSLQIDDQDAGLSQNVLLATMRLSEIERIEISTSPTASAQKNGEGGIINVKLKPVAKGLSGSATADIYTNFLNTVNLSPAVFVNYGKDKWQIRANAILEYYRPQMHELREIRTRDFSATTGRDTLSTVHDTARTHDLQETAKLHIGYQPTTQDKLTFVVMENTRWQRTNTRSLATTYQPIAGYEDLFKETHTPITQDHTDRQFHLMAQAKYTHEYLSGGKFETSLLYTYRNQNDHSRKHYPTQTDSTLLPRQELADNSSTPHEVQFNISTKHAICPMQLGLYDSEMWLTFEVNTSYTDTRSSIYQEGLRDHTLDYEQHIALLSRQLYVSPVVQWDYRIGGVKLQAGVRYQMLRRRMHTDLRPDWTNHEHDITANINAVWKITAEHSLRFAVARNIVRPKDEQVFPHAYYLPATQELLVGNDSLHAAYFHNAGVNYLYSHRFSQIGDGRIITNVGLEYIRADGMIRKQRRTYPTPYGVIPYKTYINQTAGNVISATASLFVRYKVFSLSFSGNLYANLQQSGSTHNYYWYYNLSLAPIFAFRHHWTLSGKVMYNSKIETSYSLMGDCFYAQLRLSKDIGNWNIHAELSDLFDIQTVDRSNTTSEQYATEDGIPVSSIHQQETLTRTYDLYKRLLMIGAVYHF